MEVKEIFDFMDYKDYVNHWVETHPKGARGRYKAMADHLEVGTVLISQIFKGQRDLTLDQAFLLTEHMQLLELEKEYFLKLVHLARAGHFKYRQHIEQELASLKGRSQSLRERLQRDRELSDEEKARFYSSWHYSAIRVISSIEDYQTKEAMAERLKLTPEKITQALDFLLQSGLMVQEQGRFKAGPQFTHLESDSPYIKTRHMAWRLKAFDRMENPEPESMHFTSVAALAAKDIPVIRRVFVKALEEYMEVLRPSPEEELACLTIDWFRV